MTKLFEKIEPCKVCGHDSRWNYDGWDDEEQRIDYYKCLGTYKVGEVETPCDNRAKLVRKDFEQTFYKR